MNRKHLELEIKGVSNDGLIEGYGSVFNNVDHVKDVVLPGSFKKTLSERKPKLLWQHDPLAPIGVIEEAFEDKSGLRIKARLAKTGKGAEVKELIEMGAIDGLSIGYQTVKDKFVKGGIRNIEEVKLLEVSVVTFPANELAVVQSIKARFDEDMATEAEKIAQIVNNLLALQRGLVSVGTENEEPPEQAAKSASDEALTTQEAAKEEPPPPSIEPQLSEVLHSLAELKSQLQSVKHGTGNNRS